MRVKSFDFPEYYLSISLWLVILTPKTHLKILYQSEPFAGMTNFSELSTSSLKGKEEREGISRFMKWSTSILTVVLLQNLWTISLGDGLNHHVDKITLSQAAGMHLSSQGQKCYTSKTHSLIASLLIILQPLPYSIFSPSLTSASSISSSLISSSDLCHSGSCYDALWRDYMAIVFILKFNMGQQLLY